MTVKIWLRDSAEELAMLGIPTALLDAELILAHTLRQNRTWLHAHGDEAIEPRRLEIANARLDLRKDRVPVAYIVGHREFYGRIFKVTPAVLIPRPESENLITALKAALTARPVPGNSVRLVDVGTGSGCLGITAKLELPTLHVTLADIDNHALKVAEENAKNLNASVDIIRSDLLSSLQTPAIRFDIILANLPYVDTKWERSPETSHEPSTALFAADGGLALIKKLVDQTEFTLVNGGLLILEADPCQHDAIAKYAKDRSLTKTAVHEYCVVLTKN